jgi:SAM-dependent methyltransferase
VSISKVSRHLRQHGAGSLVGKLRRELPAYVRHVRGWKLRRCRCCGKGSLFLNKGVGEEFDFCLFCGANLRYELLAAELRSRFGNNLAELRVVELDPASPLRTLFATNPHYVRSFYAAGTPAGQQRSDGARCEDIMDLSLADCSVELIVSSDVLEHVPDLQKAFSETFRVLVPGGVHLFTVPPRGHTKARAVMNGTNVIHNEAPEYHCDPLNREGVLTFWDIGPDLPNHVHVPGLTIRVVRGPNGVDRRVVWAAQRCRSAQPGAVS